MRILINIVFDYILSNRALGHLNELSGTFPMVQYLHNFLMVGQRVVGQCLLQKKQAGTSVNHSLITLFDSSTAIATGLDVFILMLKEGMQVTY